MSDFDDYDEIDPKAVARRVKEAREKINLTQIDLARRSESSQQTICNLERGQVKIPRNIPRIASALQVMPRFLLTGRSGDGVPLVQASKFADAENRLAKKLDFDADIKFIIPTKAKNGDSFEGIIAVYVEDTAMTITAATNDVVIVNTKIQHGPGMLVLIADGGRYTVRKVRSIKGSNYEYAPENDDFPTFAEGEAKTVGVITEIRKFLQ